MTAVRLRALRIFARFGAMRPREFAEKLWPDSDGWNRYHNCGYGSSRGSMMAMAGGGYIGKLRKARLVDWVDTPRGQLPLYGLSREGRAEMEAGDV